MCLNLQRTALNISKQDNNIYYKQIDFYYNLLSICRNIVCGVYRLKFGGRDRIANRSHYTRHS